MSDQEPTSPIEIGELLAQVKVKLTEAMSPSFINIIDESHLHIGHEGAKGGGKHLNLEIISEEFTDKSAIERHRMIYVALGEIMGTDIHALSINAQTLEERQLATEEGSKPE
jgi:BolA family transcriptional regulator, general stress-responsive regulator